VVGSPPYIDGKRMTYSYLFVSVCVLYLGF
jgi:hypothetical protein